MLRRIPFEKIENFRDLGGYSSFYGETQFGVVFRSGTFSDATSLDVETLAKIGIKSIIDIRDDKSKSEKPDKTLNDSRFMSYLLSVNGNGRVPQNAKDQIVSYLEMLEEPVQARKIFLALAHCQKPCVIHCVAGKDRTGCFIAVLMLANGVPFHDVNADYMLSFPYLTRLTAETRKNHPDFPKVVLEPNARFLERVFDSFFKKYGDVDEYFSAIGISDDDITLLKNLLGRQEKSCGAVVFHDGKILVEHMKLGHYSITKGHVESFDKSDEDTALREIKEETGVSASLLSKETFSIDYSPSLGIAKRVIFYVAEAKDDKTKPQPEEVSAIYWLSPNDAIRTVSHDTDKHAILWACKVKAEL
jgi:protein-tyrosine phosphatase